MDDTMPKVPPPVRIMIVDRDGRPTKEMADFMHRLWRQVQAQTAQIKDLNERLDELENH